jgi:phage baseplate assembly protein W
VADLELERDAARRRLLGWSVACEPIMPGVDLGRDLVLSGGNGAPLDLARVESMDCLGQSLTIALTTALGSDMFNTSFGFDGLNAIAEESEPVLMRERVRISVIQVLRKEPRVSQILDVDLAGDRMQPPPAGSRELDVNVTFETVSLDRPSMRLGRVTTGG